MRYFAPVLAAVLGNLLYHTSQRLTPAGANPFLTVGLSFGTASALCLLLYAVSAPGRFFSDVRFLSWTTLGLGFAVAVIETSFLLAYRLGWPIGITGLVVTAGQTALLLPLGYFFLGERLAPAAWAGAGLCLAGLALIGWGGPGLMALRVLVVDDEPGIREVLSRYLEGKGFSVAAEGSAETALLRLVQESFDAVLLDVELPGLSGLRALPSITEEKRAAVFIMTGHADSELEKDAKLLGARALFSKPLELEKLAAALAALSPAA